jgi:hypothetical protein
MGAPQNKTLFPEIVDSSHTTNRYEPTCDGESRHIEQYLGKWTYPLRIIIL